MWHFRRMHRKPWQKSSKYSFSPFNSGDCLLPAEAKLVNELKNEWNYHILNKYLTEKNILHPVVLLSDGHGSLLGPELPPVKKKIVYS